LTRIQGGRIRDYGRRREAKGGRTPENTETIKKTKAQHNKEKGEGGEKDRGKRGDKEVKDIKGMNK